MNSPVAADCPTCGSTALRDGVCSACIFGSALDFLSSGAPAEPAAEAPPRRVGDYDLLEEIARGGMGVVWRARHRRLNRGVALKFVLEGVLPGEMAARRFRQEAEVAAQLSHPHIISVYEVGEADGRYFISMELADGGTLAERLLGGKFPARAAAELAVKLARAVQHAHERGVLHRDLKPGNVLFDAAGEPRITDFGLARLITDRTALTLTGAVMGTPSYMPPEQARGETASVTTAGDIYGLGAILYELLAGRPAFAGGAPVEVLRRVLDEEPPSLADTDRDLETICQKCLAKNPAGRYASARALAEDLDRWLHGEPIRARRMSVPERLWKWVRRRPLLAALWLALTTAAGVITNLVVTSRVEIAEARGAAAASAVESQHRIADRHTTAAILAIDGGDSLRALPSLAEAIRIGTGDARRDRVNRIRFGAILRQAPVLEQMWFPVELQDVHLPATGDVVLFCEFNSVFLRRISDGQEAAPRMDAGDKVLHAVLHPTLSRVIAATASGHVQMWDAVTGEHLAQKDGTFLRAPDLFPDGEPCMAVWSGRSVRRFSPADRDFNSPPLEHPAEVEWAWLGGGRNRILTCAADRRLRVWDAETATVIGEPVPCEAGTALMARPAGSMLVHVRPPEQSGWTIDLTKGGPADPLPVAGEIRAALCASGQILTARSQREGFVVSVPGTGEVSVTATHGSRGNDVRFSADGFRVFTRARDSSGRLWTMDGGRALTPFLWQGNDPRQIGLNAAADRILVSSRDPEVRLWRVRPDHGAVSVASLPPVAARADWLSYQLRDRARALPKALDRPGTGDRPSLRCLTPQAVELRVITADGTDLFPPLVHHASIVDAVLSPDGRCIASFTTSQGVYLWDADTGSQIGPVLRHDRMIEAIEFSPDSLLLASAGAHTLRLWEAATGMAAAPPMLHRAPIYGIRWSGDSHALFTTDNTGAQAEWNVSPEAHPFSELGTLARLYSAHRLTAGGALAPLSLTESRAARKAWRQ